MRRRDVLAGSLGTFAAASFPAPSIAQERRDFKMVTDWPEGPGLYASAVRLAETIEIASSGRIRIEVFPAGAFVRPFETFDAVQAGIAEMFHSAGTYFGDKSPASAFFSAIPFGLTSDELFAWVHHGGGQGLWDEAYGQFDIKPFLASTTGAQMGGWFSREIGSLEEFKGLRYRMPGLGGEVLRRLGATVLILPGGEILQSLQSGAIDASEWNGPWLDMVLGLHKVSSYYYYPGFHEPGTGLFLGVNARVWDRLSAGDRRLIEAAAAAEFVHSLAECNANNAVSLRKLREEGAVTILKFDDSLLKEFLRISQDVVAEIGSGDELSRKIYASYQQFRVLAMDWSDVAERSFMNSRMIS
jgi:TRAP-type mannitol/chloroaromatic compound transport system substrate-binding protein